MAFNADVGGASANSYILVADATTYFTERLNATAWTNATTAQKEASLIMGTRWLDTEIWAGEKATTTQALKWPRLNCYDDEGNAIDDETIPSFIKYMTCELALYQLNRDPDTELLQEQYEEVKIETLMVKYRRYLGYGLPSDIARLAPLSVLYGRGNRVVRA